MSKCHQGQSERVWNAHIIQDIYEHWRILISLGSASCQPWFSIQFLSGLTFSRAEATLSQKTSKIFQIYSGGSWRNLINSKKILNIVFVINLKLFFFTQNFFHMYLKIFLSTLNFFRINTELFLIDLTKNLDYFENILECRKFSEPIKKNL
jgi:hypothetical protein